MFLPAGRHPYISVLKQIRDVETTGIIFNSFVTNGFLRWYITTELLSLFPSMIWWKITFKTTNYNYKRKVLNTKKKYYDGYGSGLRRIRRRHEGNKATEKSSFVCSLFSVPLSLEPAITFRADLCPLYCLGRRTTVNTSLTFNLWRDRGRSTQIRMSRIQSNKLQIIPAIPFEKLQKISPAMSSNNAFFFYIF